MEKGNFLTKDNLRMHLRDYGNMKFFQNTIYEIKGGGKVYGKYKFDFNAY